MSPPPVTGRGEALPLPARAQAPAPPRRLRTSSRAAELVCPPPLLEPPLPKLPAMAALSHQARRSNFPGLLDPPLFCVWLVRGLLARWQRLDSRPLQHPQVPLEAATQKKGATHVCTSPPVPRHTNRAVPQGVPAHDLDRKDESPPSVQVCEFPFLCKESNRLARVRRCLKIASPELAKSTAQCRPCLTACPVQALATLQRRVALDFDIKNKLIEWQKSFSTSNLRLCQSNSMPCQASI